MRILTLVHLVLAFFACQPARYCSAGIVTNFGGRWDAAPRVISGNERSLDGGIRYAMEGGTAQAFRDRFSWSSLPSVSSFQQAVQQSFGAWTINDPASGLGTALSFVPDTSTSIVRQTGYGSLNINGAEIDLLASDAGSSGLMGVTVVSFLGIPVTLTSGVSNYGSSVAIQGVDLHINNNSQASYTLDTFRRILTHEIGHAIGFMDADLGGNFIDDNYKATDPVGTLNNSWASLVNPLDPVNSAGLGLFTIPGSQFAVPGVDLLMESNGLGIGPGNPLSNLFPLTNDEFGTRQFLYPSITAVPEPGSLALLAIVFGAAGMRFRRRCEPAVV